MKAYELKKQIQAVLSYFGQLFEEGEVLEDADEQDLYFLDLARKIRKELDKE
jgi:hypothetical protein